MLPQANSTFYVSPIIVSYDESPPGCVALFAPAPRKCYTLCYTARSTIGRCWANLQSIRGCMSARKKRWVLRDPAPADFIASLSDRSPLAATLLYQRGLRDQPSIAAFLSTDYKHGIHDPFLLK